MSPNPFGQILNLQVESPGKFFHFISGYNLNLADSDDTFKVYGILHNSYY